MGINVLAVRPESLERRSTATSAGRSVLVIDDDPFIRRLVQFILQSERIGVETAEDGQRGLVRALARRPSVVLLDLTMLSPDGEAVARALRAAWGPSLRIVLMGRGDDLAEAGRRVGADDVLSKPFSWAAVLGVIQRTLAEAA